MDELLSKIQELTTDEELHDKIQELQDSHTVIIEGKLVLMPKGGFTQKQIDEITWKANLIQHQTSQFQKLVASVSPEELVKLMKNPDPFDLAKNSTGKRFVNMVKKKTQGSDLGG
jgi:hypothetical protein